MPSVETIVIGAICSVFLLYVFLFGKKKSPLVVLPGPPPDNPIFGNLESVNGPSRAAYFNALTEKYGGVVKLHNIIGMKPQLLISDPESLHSILAENGHSWPKPNIFNTMNGLLFGQGVVTVAGEAHRRQRKTLAPIFSTQQMRAFLPGFFETTRGLCSKIREDIASTGSNEATLDALRFSSQTALDIVGSAIGYDFNTIKMDSEYSRTVKQVFPTLAALGPLTLTFGALSKLGPWSFRKRVVDFALPRLGTLGATGLRLMHIVDVMEAKTTEIFSEKKKALEEGELFDDGPKDVVTALLKGSKAGEEDALEENEILGQIQTMIFAGHETTSTIMTRCLQILSTDQDLQDRLRSEFAQARLRHGDDDLDHETLQSLPLLDAIIKESLRLFAPLPATNRESCEDTILPLAVPIKLETGEEVREVVVPKGTYVTLAIDAANRSKLLFGEDADEFKPERWLNGGPNPPLDVKNPSVYFSMLTFLGGFRSCLGFKFAVLELKVVIYSIVNAFVLSPALLDDEIEWKTGAALFPMIRGQEDRGPQLPLKVRII